MHLLALIPYLVFVSKTCGAAAPAADFGALSHSTPHEPYEGGYGQKERRALARRNHDSPRYAEEDAAGHGAPREAVGGGHLHDPEGGEEEAGGIDNVVRERCRDTPETTVSF